MSKDTGKKIAIGAAIAGVAGYLAGVLTAPKSGKETRADVKNAAVQAKLRAEKQLKKLHSDLSVQIDKAVQQAHRAKKGTKQELDKAIKAATQAKEKARTVLTAVHEGGAEDKDLDAAVKDAKTALSHLQTFIKRNEN